MRLAAVFALVLVGCASFDPELFAGLGAADVGDESAIAADSQAPDPVDSRDAGDAGELAIETSADVDAGDAGELEETAIRDAGVVDSRVEASADVGDSSSSDVGETPLLCGGPGDPCASDRPCCSGLTCRAGAFVCVD